MPTDSFKTYKDSFAKFRMSNPRGLLRTKNMSTQNMSNSCGSVRTQNTSTQNMSNL